MPGWPGWLACLTWLGWLGWIGWNDWLKVPHARRSEEVGGYLVACCLAKDTGYEQMAWTKFMEI